jgi:hypothetical protein
VVAVFILEEKLKLNHLHPFQRINHSVGRLVLKTVVIDKIQHLRLFPLRISLRSSTHYVTSMAVEEEQLVMEQKELHKHHRKVIAAAVLGLKLTTML